MKKVFVLILFIFSVKILVAQKQIKVDQVQLMQIQIPVNPLDTLWRTFQMPPSLFKGIPLFKADVNTPFYSSQQIALIKNQLEKILNPDKYFESLEEYNQCLHSFSSLLKKEGTK